jgi:hypothetical protein
VNVKKRREERRGEREGGEKVFKDSPIWKDLGK